MADLVSLSLVSSSFLSPVDGSPPRVSLPIYNHLFRFPFLLRHRHPPTRVPILPECSPLSKYYFLHGDKCKTKTYLFYTLLFCKYAGIATGRPDLFPSLSFFLLLASTFAIFLTIVHIQHSTNEYDGVVQLGRVVLLFRERLLVNSDAPAHILRLWLLRRI